MPTLSTITRSVMHIGSLTLENPFVLAPLAGYTDLSFRLLCRELGAALCFSEMISCHGLVYGQKKTLELLATVPAERPVSFQLFGADPQVMGDAAAIINRYPIDLIDINMGCPVRKVVRKGAGAALMKDMSKAGAIISAVCRNTELPVTVKFRSGWHRNEIIAGDFAQMAQDAGASGVTVHGRTWAQGFGGQADWSVIAAVKSSVTVPVIGNGDIQSHRDGVRMMAETGCDGVMIGRAALGNPWVFQPAGRPDTLRERLPVILRHLELAGQFLPARKVLFKVKNHISRYFTGLPGATRLRRQISAADSIEMITAMLNSECFPP